LAQRNQDPLAKYVKKFNHEILFMEDLELDVTLVSFINRVRYKGLSEKFIMERPATLKGTLKMIKRYI